MRRVNGAVRTPGALIVAAALCFSSITVASPFNHRAPQVPVLGGGLQTYLDGLGQPIDVQTDQMDGQVWSASISSGGVFLLDLAASTGGQAFGFYDAGGPPVPVLYQVFPAEATNGWFATADFGGGNLVVTLFDNNSVILGQTFYAGVSANNFGFYVHGPGGTFYSQDARNGGLAQVLTYPVTGGYNYLDWWQCFEDGAPGASDRDFDDAVLRFQGSHEFPPTSVDGTTWGRIKTLYRK